MIGQTISHYKILEKLGEGGMGIVYKAHDTELDRDVALKFLPNRITTNEAEQVRFLQEARASALLNHPNICTVHAIEKSDNEQFIVMEYVDGKTLREMIPMQKIQTAIDYAIQIGEALQEAHSKGIVHRDVKTDNIMVNSKNQIKVMDFGLAKLKGSLKLTKTSSTVGTLAYMAPEQIQGGAVDARSDIFSFGAVLYEMLTGRHPFRGEHEVAMMYSILNEEPQPLSHFRKDIPSNIASIMLKALQKDPFSRYQTMQEMINDLNNAPAIQLPKQKKSIVVLPFDDLSPGRDQEYFSDGLTEEIISDLSNVRSLRVISRSSAMTFKGKKKTIPEIAGQLNVQFVLEGSVRKAGNSLRITAQLIDSTNDAHLWAEKYSGTLDDVFDIQEKVSRSIVAALRITLLSEERDMMAKRHTESLDAYNLYLKGRYFWNQRNQQGMIKAINYFQQAISNDPLYALAYTGLADCYNLLGFYCSLSGNESFPKAKAAATEALAINKDLAEGLTSRAFAELYYDWNWEECERDFKKAIELNPAYPTAHHWFAEYLAVVGRIDDALIEAKRALEFDPLSLVMNALWGWVLYFSRQYDMALEQCRKIIEMDPNFVPAHLFLGFAYSKKGMLDEAVAAFQNAASLFGESSLMLGGLGHAYAACGKGEEARRVLDELMRIKAPKYLPSYFIAAIFADLGETDRAFDWLGRAYEDRDGWLAFLKVDPIWESVCADSRYIGLLRKMKLEK